jgi:hypothetical protein
MRCSRSLSGIFSSISQTSRALIDILRPHCVPGFDIAYVGKDVPATSRALIDPLEGTFGLLQLGPPKPFPGYLQHMSIHLIGLADSQGANNLMREHASQILTASNIVNEWFQQIRLDAKELLAMNDEQLHQQQALTLLNDIKNYANFALNGHFDQVTGNTLHGVEWIYETMLTLATMDITPYNE